MASRLGYIVLQNLLHGWNLPLQKNGYFSPLVHYVKNPNQNRHFILIISNFHQIFRHFN